MKTKNALKSVIFNDAKNNGINYCSLKDRIKAYYFNTRRKFILFIRHTEFYKSKSGFLNNIIYKLLCEI